MDFRLNPVSPFCDFLFTKSPIIFNLFANSLYSSSTSSSCPILPRRHHYLVVDTDICFILCSVDIIILLSTSFSSFLFFLLFANPNLLLFSSSLILLTDETKTRLNHTSQHSYFSAPFLFFSTSTLIHNRSLMFVI